MAGVFCGRWTRLSIYRCNRTCVRMIASALPTLELLRLEMPSTRPRTTSYRHVAAEKLVPKKMEQGISLCSPRHCPFSSVLLGRRRKSYIRFHMSSTSMGPRRSRSATSPQLFGLEVYRKTFRW